MTSSNTVIMVGYESFNVIFVWLVGVTPNINQYNAVAFMLLLSLIEINWYFLFQLIHFFS